MAPDRASHASLSHIYWDNYETNENSMTKTSDGWIDHEIGRGTCPAGEILAVATPVERRRRRFSKRRLRPGAAGLCGGPEKSRESPAALALTLQASDSSPVVNPAIVIKNWGDAAAQLKINGKPVNWGKDFRRGYVQNLDGTDLVVWIRQESVTPVQIALTPAR